MNERYASIDPKLLAQAVRAHFKQSSDHSTQRVPAEKAAKHKDNAMRAVTQGEVTANTK